MVLYHHSSRLVTVEGIIILLSEELENVYFLIIRSFESDSKRTFSIDTQFSNECDSMISIELGIGMVFMIRTQKISVSNCSFKGDDLFTISLS